MDTLSKLITGLGVVCLLVGLMPPAVAGPGGCNNMRAIQPMPYVSQPCADNDGDHKYNCTVYQPDHTCEPMTGHNCMGNGSVPRYRYFQCVYREGLWVCLGNLTGTAGSAVLKASGVCP